MCANQIEVRYRYNRYRPHFQQLLPADYSYLSHKGHHCLTGNLTIVRRLNTQILLEAVNSIWIKNSELNY